MQEVKRNDAVNISAMEREEIANKDIKIMELEGKVKELEKIISEQG